MLFIMLSVAGLLWLIQFLCSLTGVGEIVSEIIGFCQDGLFVVWFWFLKVNYSGKNGLLKFGTVFGCSVVDIIPFINDIPVIIVEIIVMTFLSRKEDQEKAKTELAAAQQAAAEQAIARQQYMEALARRQARAANDNLSQEELRQAA